ncbi:probable LRR receptor-like serine/threonine-protein kinase At3g47570 [Juglans microcarpa x Juglans regia]|uniref:probable LRR receptor-like serine/threonine-protein kinase At3g47570 n=1 Tax=Juglans microcarpa x Juglans regia TaxID=2249226 RepID=UPI001B7EC2BE|nr:probable LRR receptor-like serine/threonine-protein kinase At3g47570 [Juglans microcarpa x Juglans regia]
MAAPTSFLIMLYFVCGFSIALAAAPNITTDQSALLALKAHISFDPQNHLTKNWSTNTSVCNWVGVICGSRHYRVSVLNLSFMGLIGELPKIGNLTMLTELYLDDNNFEGRLSPEIGNLTMLTVLYLDENNFEGRLPPEIGNLTMLTELYLSSNKFEGLIPNQIGNLQNLEVFDIEINGFFGTIPFGIFNISTIRWIGMTSNNLSGHLPSNMGLFLPNLQRLFLGINKLSGTIPNSISNASKLEIVELSWNSFSGLIPKTLGNLIFLKMLNLEFNDLTVESPELSIFSDLSSCINLVDLLLSKNHLNGFLPKSIGNLSLSLQTLYLYDCKLKGSIPTEIGNLSGLTMLTLSSNELRGLIPTTIGSLRMLQGLGLDGNRLKGTIPPELCYLSRLFELFLVGNDLSGHIPRCIDNMTSLRALYLGFNQLTSVIPLSLWRLTHLSKVDFSSNSLSGSLSSEIAKMKVLRILNLSRNQLSGDIPKTIGALKDLTNLSLALNRLEGSIPISFGELVSLEFLDLSNNNLSGEIPKSLEGLHYLYYLNLSFNKLQGEIPTKGPFLNFSTASFMSNNALCGAARLKVPPCEEGNPRKRKTTWPHMLRYVLPAIGFIMLALTLAFSWKRWKKRNLKSPAQADMYPLVTWRRISHQQLVQATNGFNSNNLLGEGSFGSVYQGTLSDGMNIAIKIMNLQVKGAFKSFDAECEVLRNIRHRNLVKIITICTNIDFKALVLEYMPNGNLDKWLHSQDHYLNILQRLNIMIDIASALEYLHHGYSAAIIHCDLKPSNVLLDEEMVAHVADFGMAKLLDDRESLMQTMTLATFGYMAPEYGLEGVVSTRGDVYSYGILLMETFTRKKPTDDMFIGEMTLKHWVDESLVTSILDIIDVNLLRNEKKHAAMEDCISSVMRLALDCCAESPPQRIDIKNVSTTLNKVKLKFVLDSRRS